MSDRNDAAEKRPKAKLGMVLVISGPSGVGKDTVWQTARHCLPSFGRATTCTTRARREGEVEGVNYYYVSNEEFDRMDREGELVEWAWVHGNRYGVPKRSIDERITEGQDVVCIIEVQGAIKIRNLFTTSTLVFIKPPPGQESEVLSKRIQGRSVVDPTELATRLKTADWEMTQIHLYDYEIVNDDLNRAAQELCEVVALAKAQHDSRVG